MEENKPKPRPIIRLGVFLISHSLLVSVVCCTAGVLALLILPVLGKNTYISENAIMPGSATPMLSNDDVSEGQKFMNKILSFETTSTGIEIAKMTAEHIIDLGGEVNHHQFLPHYHKFHPLHFFLSPGTGAVPENYSCLSYGVNTIGIARAPRGDGKEAIVLVTPYNSLKITQGEALSLGIAYTLFSLLSKVIWLSKDIIWLAADSRHGEYSAVDAWLRDYHTATFGDWKHSETCAASNLPEVKTIHRDFRRAGTMAAALVIKVADRSTEFNKDALTIYAEASNGQMPNLDLINIVNYLAVHGQGYRVKVEKIWSLLNAWWLKGLGQLVEMLGKFAGSLNPQWNFGIPVSEYVECTATLARSLYNQALGIPTGPHGAFRDFQVDAITMEISPKFSSSLNERQHEILLHVGRLVEGVVRSVNNLLEKFHQSFFLYLLTSPNRFVSVGVYMIAFALLVAPLPLVAAALFSGATKLNPDTKEVKSTSNSASTDKSALTFRSWKWLYAAKQVLLVNLWSIIVTILPYFIDQIPDSTPTAKLSIWMSLSIITLLFLDSLFGSSFTNSSQSQRTEWTLLKSVTIASTFIGVCLMSVINFATAEIGALLLVPMCLTIAPLRLDNQVNTLRALVQGVCSVIFTTVGFPPTIFFVFKGVFEGFENLRFGDFWNWAESLWAWNSATYIYMCMVHLPCWVLCIQTLLHRP